MNHPEYNEAAYLRAIADQLERYLMENYVGEDKDSLLCEFVLYADREVPQSAFHSFLAMLRGVSKQATERMAGFEVKKREPAMAIPMPDTEEDQEDGAGSTPVRRKGPASVSRGAPRKT